MPAPHASPPTPLPPAEDAQKAIKNTPSVEQVLAGGIEQYDALFVPGGWVNVGAALPAVPAWPWIVPRQSPAAHRPLHAARPRLQARHRV